MVRKKLAIAILALSALQANVADAMGLGNLSVKSALNQPLNAEIKLLDTGDLDSSQIKIRLATPEDFQHAGVDRDYFLTNLRFDIDMDGHGGGTIKVTTREPVVEPYLNFVVEARWPNGRLLREFAVLLDPPTFSANKAAAPITPATAGSASTSKSKAVQPPSVRAEVETQTSTPAADMSLPPAGKSGEYRVQVYDTLSKIAARLKPGNDVSIAQTMIAIQRANPQAFIHNNLNLIKSGSVLRVPSADDMRGISAAQATQEVDAQIQEWHSGRSSVAARASAAGPQLDASAPEPNAKEGNYREQARLSIATGGDTDKSAKGSGSSGKGIEALRQQLAESQEALEKGKRENKEVQSRLDDMERQVATLQRLISLKDEQLAAMQAKSGASSANKSAPLPTPEAVKPTTTATPTPTPAASTATTAPTAAPAPAAEIAPASTPAPEVKPTPKPAPVKPAPKPAVAPAPASGYLDQIVAHPSYYLYGGIGAMILGLAAAYIGKRRKEAAEEAEADNLTFGHEDFRFDADAEEQQKEVAPDGAIGGEAEDTDRTVVEMPKKSVRSETGDPIAESDIYIAYGRYQQAVDLLTTAIEAEPQRSDLRVKLLEVFIETRNKEAFREQFVELQALHDSDAVARVKDLMSSVDGISDWLDGLPAGSSASGSAFGGAAAAAAVGVAAAEIAEAAEPELDLDFDETEVGFGEPAQTGSLDIATDDLADLEASFANEANISDEENPVEFDLDLDSELPSGETESELANSFLGEPETAPAFDKTGSSAHLEFDSLESTDFEASSHEPAAKNTAEGLELDLGEDDLDQALSNMGDTEGLGDLEDLSSALGDTDAETDLDANLEALPEEFDLSQSGGELPEVERPESDLTDLSFEESSSVPVTEREPEIDVFAGLNQPAAAPIEPVQSSAPAAPTLDGDDFDFLADTDEVATKLDLARAYIDMGDTEGARDILDEVLHEGTDTQKQEASNLLSRIG